VTPGELAKRIVALPEAWRFILAGSLAALVNWLVRFPLSWIMPFAGAVAVANVIGMVFGFLSYRFYVFPGSSRQLAHQLRDFIMVNLLSMSVVVLVSVVAASYMLPWIGWLWQTEAVSHALGIGAGAVTNYFGHRRFSFARH